MINLLDEKNFKRRWDNVNKEDYSGYYFTGEMSYNIQHKLEQGLKNQELIYTQDLRGIGKTYELVQFAKKRGFWVVESNETIAKILREKYNFKNIYGQDNITLRKMQIVLVDECVNVEKLLKDMDCNIVTGFTTEKKYADCNTRSLLSKLKDEYEDINIKKCNDLISVLDNEVEQLIVKINKARNEENWGTYKNLVLALTEVIKLKDKEREKDWQLMYSEYKLNDENGQKQVAVWEKNGEDQIRNYKVWNVEKDDKQIKPTVNITMYIENINKLEQALKDLEDKMKNTKINLTI